MQCCIWQSFAQAPLIPGAPTLLFSLVTSSLLGVLGSASSLEVRHSHCTGNIVKTAAFRRAEVRWSLLGESPGSEWYLLQCF